MNKNRVVLSVDCFFFFLINFVYFQYFILKKKKKKATLTLANIGGWT